MVAREKEAEAKGKLKLVALGKAVAVIASTVVFLLRHEPAPLNSTIDSCQRRQSLGSQNACRSGLFSGVVVFALVDCCNNLPTSMSVKPRQVRTLMCVMIVDASEASLL